MGKGIHFLSVNTMVSGISFYQLHRCTSYQASTEPVNRLEVKSLPPDFIHTLPSHTMPVYIHVPLLPIRLSRQFFQGLREDSSQNNDALHSTGGIIDGLYLHVLPLPV